MAGRKPTIVTAGFSTEISKALEPVKQSVEMITGARAGYMEIRGLPVNTSAKALIGKVNEIVERINASGEYICQRDTAESPLGDIGGSSGGNYLPLTGGTLTGPVTGTTFTATSFTGTTFNGNLVGNVTGNADTATKATNDSDGNAIKTSYLKLTGGTLTGALYGTSANFTGALVGLTVQASSDKRLKKNINNYDADISTLHAKSYVLKRGNLDTHIGLIAQDVAKCIPAAVSEEYDDYLSLDYNAIVAVLVNKVNALDKRLAKLEGRK